MKSSARNFLNWVTSGISSSLKADLNAFRSMAAYPHWMCSHAPLPWDFLPLAGVITPSMQLTRSSCDGSWDLRQTMQVRIDLILPRIAIISCHHQPRDKDSEWAPINLNMRIITWLLGYLNVYQFSNRSIAQRVGRSDHLCRLQVRVDNRARWP